MKYTCIADAAYALLVYMLYATDDMLQNTTYFVGKNLAPCQLSNKIVMPPIVFTDCGQLRYRLCCLKYRWNLFHSKIYAQDHLSFSAPLIDNLKYECLEDCPNFFLIREERGEPPYRDSRGSHWMNFKFGRIFMRYAGNNPWCRNRIITSDRDRSFFEKKRLPYEQINLESLWQQASEFKRETIARAFALPGLSSIQKETVIFSQPLTIDAKLSNDEVAAIFRPYVNQYGAENILVKLHPRDNFDYKAYFPGVTTLCTKAPQQLLSIMGIRFRTAITVCSSAVSSMDKDCNVIWLGSEIDPRIINAYGVIKCPTLN